MSARPATGRMPGARSGADPDPGCGRGATSLRGRGTAPLRGDGTCEEAEDGRSAPFGTSLVAQVGGPRE